METDIGCEERRRDYEEVAKALKAGVRAMRTASMVMDRLNSWYPCDMLVCTLDYELGVAVEEAEILSHKMQLAVLRLLQVTK